MNLDAKKAMNTYAVMLRPMIKRGKRAEYVSLEANALRHLAASIDIELLDVLTCRGIFDAVLLCRARDNRALSHLLDALQGWQTEALMGTSHTRYERDASSFPDSKFDTAY
ncbi:MAG TPA: hypothetical protein VGR93_01615 [Candidatus Acidoferrales bacterium]|nr:hypothetical protein [Candidatus Acidoferrales bacterium]